MPITISGDGTITGISAGGLPDNSVQTADIADDQITLAKMAGGTDGQIITYDASGNPVAVGPGTDGQVLTSTGAGSPPAFEAAAAGGKVLQIVAANEQNQLANPSSMTTHIDLDITPTSASSKFIVFYSTYGTLGNSTEIQIRCEDGTFTSGIREFRNYHSDAGSRIPITCTWYMNQSHSTGSAVTYAVKGHRSGGSDTAELGSSSATYKSTMVVMEVDV